MEIVEEKVEEKIIYKYKINILGQSILSLPKDSQILSVGTQGEDLFVWILLSPDSSHTSIIDYFFCSYFTGQPIKKTMPLKFIGTATNSQGLVSHVFLEE
jgi:hypothetical protein